MTNAVRHSGAGTCSSRRYRERRPGDRVVDDSATCRQPYRAGCRHRRRCASAPSELGAILTVEPRPPGRHARAHRAAAGTRMTEAPVRSLIADDHPVFRQGLRALIEDADDMVLVGEADDRPEAVAGAVALEPDVVLMDLQMPELGGIEATRRIVAAPAGRPHPGADHDRAGRLDLRGHARRRARLPAQGLRPRGGAAGRTASPRATRSSRPRSPSACPAARLGSRRRARLPGAHRPRARRTGAHRPGQANAEIAADLALSLKTVRNHVSNVFTKLQVTGTRQAIVKAREAGLSAPSLAPPSRG